MKVALDPTVREEWITRLCLHPQSYRTPAAVARLLRGRSDVPHAGRTCPDGTGFGVPVRFRGGMQYPGGASMWSDRDGLCANLTRRSNAGGSMEALQTFNP
ncbi:hypothetical protein Aau02nite_92150 [Amorphoplanes auranticolor]|uniref:Uncharacterized protein n=1 Tax=Actinoplanes auranticolor TaxID=47988 RepID=A0A919SYS9_9ACTN|nr:hypothetical protein Aau02nite_92150 [Actinoplanes auranticolor]